MTRRLRLWQVGLILLVVAIAGVYATADSLWYRHADIPDQPPLREGFVQWHESTVAGTMNPPYQYRILYPLVLEATHRLTGLDLLTLDQGYRIALAFAALFLVFVYLRRWFDDGMSLAGTLFLAAILPMAFPVYRYDTPDVLNLALFAAGFILIRDRRDVWLVPLLALGTLNRETVALLLIPYALYRWPTRDRMYWVVLAASLVAFAVPYLGLRWFYPRDYVTEFHLDVNVPLVDPALLGTVLRNNLKVLLLFGPFWLWPLVGWRLQPRFLKAAFCIVPPFLLVHYLVGSIREVRLWLPLSLVLIPMGLFTLFRPEPSTDVVPESS